ncbi:hypothetical protein KY314_01700 [Candidatus Woesearchaeota archaeon]|nr:hypothetical protein [Candidatus Woesearchaeota archaeon]
MFNKWNLKIHEFTGESSTNLAIKGVFFTPKESVATNSFLLLRVENPKFNIKDFPQTNNYPKPKENFNSFTLNKEAVKKILKNLPKTTALLPITENAVVVNQDKESVEILTTNIENAVVVKGKKIEEEYPNYKEILPEKTKYKTISVNANYLKKIVDYLKLFTDSKINEIRIKFPLETKGKDGIRFEAERKDTKQKAEAILMPITID